MTYIPMILTFVFVLIIIGACCIIIADNKSHDLTKILESFGYVFALSCLVSFDFKVGMGILLMFLVIDLIELIGKDS